MEVFFKLIFKRVVTSLLEYNYFGYFLNIFFHYYFFQVLSVDITVWILLRILTPSVLGKFYFDILRRSNLKWELKLMGGAMKFCGKSYWAMVSWPDFNVLL